MYLIGHIGATLGLTYFSFPEHVREKIDYRLVLIGALTPDLIDKVFSAMFFSYTRFLGHSLFCCLILTIIIYSLFDTKKGLSFCIGDIFHLIEDAGWFVPWFYPLINYEFTPMYHTPLDYLALLFSNPHIYIHEIIGFIFICGLIIEWQLYKPSILLQSAKQQIFPIIRFLK